MTKRLPDIGRRVLSENNFPPKISARLAALIADLPSGRLRPLEDREAPDAEEWNRDLQPYLEQGWLQAPWFVAETYFYRRILEATGYYRTGPGQGRDPYAGQKRRGLEESLPAAAVLAGRLAATLDLQTPVGEALPDLFSGCVWANQADLSLWPVSGERPGDPDEAEHRAHLLVDQADAAAEFLLTQGSEVRVDFILDNSGPELTADLALADFLLARGLAGQARFHVKLHPTYVSDTTRSDVYETVSAFSSAPEPALQAFGRRLEAHLRQNRLTLQTHPFWTSPLPLWELPADLRGELASAGLLIFKGDANQRRALGDRHWPFTSPPDPVLGYLPAPALFLRVLKSDVLIGLKPGQPKMLDEQDPTWLFNGHWGMIQFQLPGLQGGAAQSWKLEQG